MNDEEGVIDNSFQASRDPELRLGHLDAGQAVSDGFSAALRNFLPLTLASLVSGFVTFVACCTLLPWVAVVPLMFWGWLLMLLKAQLGRTRFSSLWAGTEDFGSVFVSMWGLMLLYILIMVPLMVVSFGAAMASLANPMVGTLVTMPIGILYSFVVVRFQLAPFLVVDRRTPVLDAFQTSWSLTGPVWGKMILLQLLNTLLLAPAQVIGVGVQYLSQPPGGAFGQPLPPEDLPLVFGLQLVMYVMMIAAITLAWSFFAAAYRQLSGIHAIQADLA